MPGGSHVVVEFRVDIHIVVGLVKADAVLENLVGIILKIVTQEIVVVLEIRLSFPSHRGTWYRCQGPLHLVELLLCKFPPVEDVVSETGCITVDNVRIGLPFLTFSINKC